ncbi:MAG: hypothetical protein H7X94_03900 [Vallitaleaceae bacterium]|nr:hypothetical protein [Vallitaleaceae bacterium]
MDQKEKRPKVKFRNLYAHKAVNTVWITVITIITFFMAIILGYFSLVLMGNVSLLFAILILLVIISIGVFFDLLGIAVTAAEETPFHAMASNRVRGAKESILILRNAGPVANFFNDVIGDISGIISGTASAAILIKINLNATVDTIVYSMLLTGIISSLTVGGKAIGKEIALRKSNAIVFKIGYLLSLFKLRKSKK